MGTSSTAARDCHDGRLLYPVFITLGTISAPSLTSTRLCPQLDKTFRTRTPTAWRCTKCSEKCPHLNKRPATCSDVLARNKTIAPCVVSDAKCTLRTGEVFIRNQTIEQCAASEVTRQYERVTEQQANYMMQLGHWQRKSHAAVLSMVHCALLLRTWLRHIHASTGVCSE